MTKNKTHEALFIRYNNIYDDKFECSAVISIDLKYKCSCKYKVKFISIHMFSFILLLP